MKTVADLKQLIDNIPDNTQVKLLNYNHRYAEENESVFEAASELPDFSFEYRNNTLYIIGEE